MTQAVSRILSEVERLSPSECADLVDHLVETLGRDIAPAVERAQLEEVQRRIGELESGKVALIPGDEALASIRRMVDAACTPK